MDLKAALDVPSDPSRVTGGREPRGVVQPIHTVVCDGAELLYQGMDGLDPGVGGTKRPERSDRCRTDVYRTGMLGEVHRLAAAPTRIQRANQFF